jgi:hypothetical protein
VHVTPDGGVLVELIGEGEPPWWCRALADWDRPEMWTAYDHIYSHEPWPGVRIS